MNKYTCNGYRSVNAESMGDAAQVFADRAARKQFGRSGYARTCAMGSYSQDGRLAEFSAFIGRTPRGEPSATVGRNVIFTVSRA